MRDYLKKNNDTRYGEHLSFKSVNGEVGNKDFNWEEKNEEFSYLGEMYDVVTVQYSADSIHICALKDARENNLAKQLAEIHHSKNANAPASGLNFLKFFSVFYIVDGEKDLYYPPASIQYAMPPALIFHSDIHEVNTPPPRC